MNNKFIWAITIFLLTTLIGLYDINASGATWDENTRYHGGVTYWTNLKRWNWEDWAWYSEHPPVSRWIYGVGAVITEKFWKEHPAYSKFNYTLTRSESVLMTAATSAIILLLGWDFFKPIIGILASIFYSLNPLVLAYAKNTSLESPTVLFFTLTIYLFLKALTSLDQKIQKRWYSLSGISLGLAMGTRLSNFLLMPLLTVIYLIFHWQQIKEGKIVSYLSKLIFVFLFSCFFVFLIWPYLWPAPITNLYKSFQFWQEQGVGSNKPWFYYFFYFIIVTPLILLIFFAIFLVDFLSRYSKDLKLRTILLAWFLTPFALFFAEYKQGGIRYCLPVFAPLAIIAALGFDELIQFIDFLKFEIKKFGINWKLEIGNWKFIILERKFIYIFSTIFVVGYLIIVNVSIHPYYLDYYNELIGGPLGASQSDNRLIEFGGWGEGVKEAIDYLNQYGEKNARVQLAIAPSEAAPKLRNDFTVLPKIVPEKMVVLLEKENADPESYVTELMLNNLPEYLVVYNIDVEVPKNYQKWYVVRVMGAELCRMYKK